MNVFIVVHFLGNLAYVKGVVAYALKISYAVKHTRYRMGKIFRKLVVA